MPSLATLAPNGVGGAVPLDPMSAMAFQPGTPGVFSPMTAGDMSSLDLSHPSFRVGGSMKISDVLRALTKVRARSTIGGFTGATSTMVVTNNRADAIPVLAPYDLASASVPDGAKPITATQAFPLFRYGGRVKALSLDELATPPDSSMNYMLYNRIVATTGVLSTLDTAIATGDGVANLKGLKTLCSAAENNRTAPTSTNPEQDVRRIIQEITCTDGGVGDGIQCLIGGLKMRRTLMSTLSGLCGMSGFRIDRRTRRMTYHYLGIPFYLTGTDESGATGKLYGANLGNCGLQLVYIAGSPESYGLTVQETPVTAATGAREFMVHGAWALVCWEKEALFEITGITFVA